MAIERAIVIAKMRSAFKKGMSASRFLTQMRVEGLSYRRSDMLADWRTQNNIAKVEGELRFVRRDRVPSTIVVAKAWLKLDKEYMYKIKVHTQTKPGEPITERFVNIMSDRPLTPREMESQTGIWWGERERYGAEELVAVQPWSAIQRNI